VDSQFPGTADWGVGGGGVERGEEREVLGTDKKVVISFIH